MVRNGSTKQPSLANKSKQGNELSAAQQQKGSKPKRSNSKKGKAAAKANAPHEILTAITHGQDDAMSRTASINSGDAGSHINRSNVHPSRAALVPNSVPKSINEDQYNDYPGRYYPDEEGSPSILGLFKSSHITPAPDVRSISSLSPPPIGPLIPPVPPTEEYLKDSLTPSKKVKKARNILLILDLNGTLLYRNKNKGRRTTASPAPSDESTTDEGTPDPVYVTAASKNPEHRPFLKEFLEYILSNYMVMVWSSAQPHNVKGMVDAVFTPEQKEQLIAIWARDTLGLTAQQYTRKSVTLKNLEVIWESDTIKAKVEEHLLAKGVSEEAASQFELNHTNTILIDDSIVKARKQPFNHLPLLEFDKPLWKNGTDVELQCAIDYLRLTLHQSNVASYIRKHPYSSVIEVDADGLPVLPTEASQLH